MDALERDKREIDDRINAIKLLLREPEVDAPHEHWLNIEQAREKACVTRRTIYNWMDKGRLTTKRTAGGAVRILESSLWRPAQEPQ